MKVNFVQVREANELKARTGVGAREASRQSFEEKKDGKLGSLEDLCIGF